MTDQRVKYRPSTSGNNSINKFGTAYIWEEIPLPVWTDPYCARDEYALFPWLEERIPKNDPEVREMAFICSACPDLGMCREYALTTPSVGFLGGLTQMERQALLRNRDRA